MSLLYGIDRRYQAGTLKSRCTETELFGNTGIVKVIHIPDSPFFNENSFIGKDPFFSNNSVSLLIIP